MTKMATKQQTWAIFCATKQDYRDQGLTYDQASKILEDANKISGYTSKTKGTKVIVKTNDAKDLHEKAEKAGMDALNACTPQPMVVVDGAKQYFVEGGPCGFASIHFKATTTANRSFLAGLKKAGLAGDGSGSDRAPWSKDSYRGGYGYWVSQGGQSIQRKETFARAFANTLRDAGLDVHVSSRLD